MADVNEIGKRIRLCREKNKLTQGELGERLGLNKSTIMDYYAIAPEKRNGGYGSKGLEVLLERFKNYKYIFEIETQNEKAENAEERKRRKAFYLRNGLKETGLFVNVYDTDFELLTPDGELTFWEYVDFLREVMYEEYVEILRPTLIAMKKK